jgi:hypothetical protein
MSNLLKVNTRVEGKAKGLQNFIGTIKQIRKEDKKAINYRVQWDSGESNWYTIRSIAFLGTRAAAQVWNPDYDSEDDERENFQVPIARNIDPGPVHHDFDDDRSVQSDDFGLDIDGERMYVKFSDKFVFTQY